MVHITNDSGATLSLPAGNTYHVSLIVPGVTSITPQDIILDSNGSVNFHLVRAPVSVGGIVFDQSGSSVPDALVEFISADGTIDTTLKANTSGSFSGMLQ